MYPSVILQRFVFVLKYNLQDLSRKEYYRDFLGGPVVKNPPANAGDRGSIPGPGRSYRLRSN